MRTTTTPYQNDYECADRCAYGHVIHRSAPMNRADAGITPSGHAGGDEYTVSNKINVALAMVLQMEMTRSLLSTWMEANLMEWRLNTKSIALATRLRYQKSLGCWNWPHQTVLRNFGSILAEAFIIEGAPIPDSSSTMAPGPNMH